MTEGDQRAYDSLNLMDEKYLINLSILKFGYTNDYVNIARKVLSDRNINIDYNNINFYVETFVNSYPFGWQKELKNMFSELIKNGWNLRIEIYSKEKYGYFICDIKSDNEILNNIVKNYVEVIDNLCSHCGSSTDVFNDQTEYWIENICAKCWITKIENRYVISKISENGFQYFKFIQPNNFKPAYFSWKDMSNFELYLPNEYSSNYGFEAEFNSEYTQLESNRDLNFFKLLKSIPKEKLSKIDGEKIELFFSNLKPCKICGKISVHNNYCLSCYNNLDKILSKKEYIYLKNFNNIENVIYEIQKRFQESFSYSIIRKYRFENDISFEMDKNFINLV
jgi:hypothetical protein